MAINVIKTLSRHDKEMNAALFQKIFKSHLHAIGEKAKTKASCHRVQPRTMRMKAQKNQKTTVDLKSGASGFALDFKFERTKLLPCGGDDDCGSDDGTKSQKKAANAQCCEQRKDGKMGQDSVESARSIEVNSRLGLNPAFNQQQKKKMKDEERSSTKGGFTSVKCAQLVRGCSSEEGTTRRWWCG